MLIRAKQLFLQKFNMSIKNEEYHFDFKSVEKFVKNLQKKVISKTVTEICTFSTFTHVRRTCFDYNFYFDAFC